MTKYGQFLAHYCRILLCRDEAIFRTCSSFTVCFRLGMRQVDQTSSCLCAEGTTKAVMLLPIIMKGRKLHFLIHTLRHLDTETIMHQTVEDTFGPSK